MLFSQQSKFPVKVTAKYVSIHQMYFCGKMKYHWVKSKEAVSEPYFTIIYTYMMEADVTQRLKRHSDRLFQLK